MTLAEIDIDAEKEIEQKDEDSFLIEEVVINEVAIRSLIPGEEELSNSEILANIKASRNHIEFCQVNQPSLSWIREMTIFIYNHEHRDEIEIANYKRADAENIYERLFPEDICGFKLNVDYGVNLERYLPRYTLIVKIKGSIPEEELYIAGLRDITAILGIK